MPATHLSCPACSQRLSLEPEALWTRMQCPRCGTEFLPIDVIPRHNTMAAIPVVRPSAGAEPAKAPPPATRPGSLAGQARTLIMGSPADHGSTGAAGAPTAAAPEFPAPARRDLLLPPPSAPGMQPRLQRAEQTQGDAGVWPALQGRPDPPPGPGGSVAPRAASVHAGGPQRVTRRSSIAMLAEGGRATTLEIALLASSFEQVARGRVKRTFRYSQLAWFAAPATGLALLVLAVSSATWLRVIAGIVAAVSSSVMLAAAVAYGLVRWRSRVARAADAGVAPEVLAAYAAIAAKPTLSAISTTARVALAVGVLAVALISVLATWRFAEATQLDRWARPVTPVVSVPAPPPPPPELPPEQRADYKVRREGHVFVNGGVLHAPPSFRSDDGQFDLVMHFHGNTQLVEESVNAAKVNALVYVVNLGIGSGAYEDRYAAPGVFEDALDRIRDSAEKRGLRGAKLRRVALSSWSAGYGAVSKIIDSRKSFDRIDALLMLDGIHVAYVDQKQRTNPDQIRLQPFIRFAKEAAEGRKLFTITHSEIKPLAYASAAETAGELLRAVGAERAEARVEPPRVTMPALVGIMAKEAERWLQQTTEARLGDLHVRGYVGQTPEHHMAHLVQMSVTVLPELAERWK